MIWHSASSAQVVEELGSNQYKGLSETDAQVRLRRYGKNQLQDKKRRSLWQILLSQFTSKTMIAVMLTALIWMISGFLVEDGHPERALFVLAIGLVMAAIGMIKESVAENALDTLRNASQPSARVLRDGEEVSVPGALVVPGDILVLRQGDYIAADARLIQWDQLRCDESGVTGEPVPVEKRDDQPLADIVPISGRQNMLYAGSTVAHGSGLAVVTATGMNTEQAKIAMVVEDRLQITTPLQEHWKSIAGNVAFGAAGVSGLVFLLGLIFNTDLGFFDRLVDSFMTGITLTATAIPQSLAATLTVVLAVGVYRMARNKVLVRHLPTIETLGKVSVICTDKTGTLTQNQMTLTRLYTDGQEVLLSAGGTLSKEQVDILLMSAMCCDASVETVEGQQIVTGDHTEGGIVAAVERYLQLDKFTVDSMYPRLCELPFDSGRKLKTSVNMIDGTPVAVVKGAPDEVLARCRQSDPKAMEMAGAMAKEALRVIAVAYKPLTEAPANPTCEELECDLIFGCIMGLADPPMPEATQAIEDAKAAGIRVVMFTGDHVSTAVSSARAMGLVAENAQVVTDQVVELLSDDELKNVVKDTPLYIGLSPDNKVRVIKALQQLGYVVAATGDGVGDVPVLRAADVGCGMGISGTDVAKGAAHVTIEDDSFSTILSGINAGRGIYENICKAIRFSLSFVLALALLMMVGLIGWQTMPLSPVQIMWLNLLVSTASVLPLGLELPAKELLRQPPRKKDRVFGQKGAKTSIVQGIVLGVSTIISYAIGFADGNGSVATTMAFATLCIGQVFGAYSARSPYSLLDFKRHHFNHWMVFAGVISLASCWLLLGGSWLTTLFGMTVLTSAQTTWMMVLAILPFVVIELTKLPAFIKEKKQ